MSSTRISVSTVQLFPFGKYKGTPYDKVPTDYLSWLSRQPWIRDHEDVSRYLITKGYLTDPKAVKKKPLIIIDKEWRYEIALWCIFTGQPHPLIKGKNWKFSDAEEWDEDWEAKCLIK